MARVSFQSAEPVAGDADERRRFDRTDLVVRVEYATVDDLFSEFTRDVNEGGVFIETDDPQPLGTTVSLLFHLPGTPEPVKTQGQVVWVSSGSDDAPAGMGVEFDDLPRDARERINELIRSIKTGG